MTFDISIKIGGEAGQGIQTVGNILTSVFQSAGLYTMAINDFESRVRGGHSFFQIRISDKPVNAPSHKIDILMALNQLTCKYHEKELTKDGIILSDARFFSEKDNIHFIPLTELSAKAGDKITSNTIAVGIILSLTGMPVRLLEDVLKFSFQKKGKDILEKNFKAAELGYDFASKFKYNLNLPADNFDNSRININGSKAIALGALASDCRFASFYPMSPATSVMKNLSAFSKDIPFIVEQAEDEIAAVNNIIGASFAGVRSITSTSGGGFCLMTEGLGLAAITETPVVIINAQRPGPATGLPTRTAQADLQFVIKSSQDDFPRFVFAPGSPEEAFKITQKAFYLSEKYQVPAIILTDQYLNDSLFTIEKGVLTIPENIKSFIIEDKELENPELYKRYKLTKNGISQRVLPCSGKAIVRVTGNEHDESGHISEDAENRNKMVNKRFVKMEGMIQEMSSPETFNKESDILMIGWGSSKYAIKEASDILIESGIDIGYIHFTDLWPFPFDMVTDLIKNKKLIMVEGNRSSQLGLLIMEQTGERFFETVLKYNGRPFYPNEICKQVKKILE